MKRPLRKNRPPSNLPLCALLLASLSVGVLAQNASPKPGQRLTEDQLLRQIDSLSPATGDPLTKAPASVTETAPLARVPAGEAKSMSEQFAATTAAASKDEPKAKRPKGATEIVSDSVDFDQKTNQAVFVGNVSVEDPEFDLRCDKLTAILKNKKTAKPANPAAPSVAENGSKKKDGGLEKAIAEGNVVITQDKVETDGSVSKSVGRAARADYNATTGEMILSGNPQVQQGINTWIAVDPATKMYMSREGRMRADRPTRMIIRDQGDAK